MSLAVMIEYQHELLEQLYKILKDEQMLLSQGALNGEAIKAVAQEKRPIYQSLDDVEKKRLSILNNYGLTDSPQAMYRLAQENSCSKSWLAMRNLAQRVKQLNELNGELIEHRLRHNQQMLNVLRESAAHHAPTYSSTGSQAARVQRLNSSA